MYNRPAECVTEDEAAAATVAGAFHKDNFKLKMNDTRFAIGLAMSRIIRRLPKSSAQRIESLVLTDQRAKTTEIRPARCVATLNTHRQSTKCAGVGDKRLKVPSGV